MFLQTEHIVQFLPKGRFSTDAVEDYRSPELEKTAARVVLSKLRPFFDVSTWDSNPPKLVRAATAMRVAGQMYNAHFADQSNEFAGYGDNLFKQSDEIIEGLISGSIIIDEVPDYSTVGEVNELDDPKFEMGERF